MRDALGSVQSILVLGGSSDIGVAIAGALAGQRSARVVLAGRDEGALRSAAAEAMAAGAEVTATAAFDAMATDDHAEVIGELFADHGGFDVVVVAFGLLGDQERAEVDASHSLDVARVNYVGALSACHHSGRLLAAQGHGALVVLSSVAGERPRRSNFVYGSSKAGIDAYAIGLHEALAPAGVHVLVVRPGFVRSKMTEGLDPAPLATTPAQVAEVVVEGLRRGKRIVWAPSTMRWVMMVLRHVPNVVFRRLPV